MPTPTISLSLTPQEATVLLGLIDLGVKAGGLNVAANAAFFLQRIQALQKTASEGPQPAVVERSPSGFEQDHSR